MGPHRFELSKERGASLRAALWLRNQQLSFRGRELFDLGHRVGAGARAAASMVVPVICLMLLLVGTAVANFSNDGTGSIPAAAAAGSGQSSGSAPREQISELRRPLVLAQRVDKSQPAEASRRPPATGPQGLAAPKEQQRAPPEPHAYEMRSSAPAEPGAGPAVSET